MRRNGRGPRRGALALLLASVAIAVPAAAQAAGPNLLPNPDFDDGTSGTLTGWTQINSSLSLDPGRTGFGGKVTRAGTLTGIKSAKIVVDAGTYVGNAWARIDDTTSKTLCLRLTEFTSGGTQVGFTEDCTTNVGTTWTALDPVTRTVPAGRLMLSVVQKNAPTGSTWVVDDLFMGLADGGGTTVPAPPTGLNATATGANSIQVTWTASTGATSYNVYRDGTAASNLVGTSTGTSFNDTGLSPSTTYQYWVSAVNGAGESAKTGPVSETTDAGPPVSGVKVAAVGDMVCDDPLPINLACSDTAMRVSDLVAGHGYQALLALGDEQYECGGLQAFNDNYTPTYGRVKSITYPVPGDEEYATSGGTDCAPNAAGFYTYFATELSRSGLSGSPQSGYYSFNLGSWHIVALNSNCGAVPCAAGSAQETWLRQDLANNTAPCTLAFWHHPRFASAGNNTAVAPLFRALYSDGAELVLSGHRHRYERFVAQAPNGSANANGVVQFVVGTGGKSLNALPTPHANSEIMLREFGVLELSLGNNAYSWQFHTLGGGVGDSGTASCH
jgi:hypothetical protein